MKNQISFIPSNISAPSSISHIPYGQNQSVTFHQQDSTDYLIDQILKQRTQRLKNSNQKVQNYNQVQVIQGSKVFIKENPNIITPSEHKLKSSLKLSENNMQIHREFPQQIMQIMHSHSISSSNSAQNNKMVHKKLQRQNFTMKQRQSQPESSHRTIESKMQSINSGSKGKSKIQITIRAVDQYQVSYEHNNNAFIEQTIKMASSNQSPSVIKHNEREQIIRLQQKSGSQKSKQLSYHDKQSSNEEKQSFIDKISNKSKPFSKKQPSKIQSKYSSSKSNSVPSELRAAESKIEIKTSQIRQNMAKNIQYFNYSPELKKNQTDQQLVNAISQQMNFINQIQNQEYFQQNIIKSERKNEKMKDQQDEDTHKVSKSELMEQKSRKQDENDKIIIQYEEFQTEYSENCRDLRILQHRNQSNIKFQMQQLKQVIILYEALIIKEEANETLKMIKDLQMKNRRSKINLRSASYSKRFNFHSPITKNNNRPLQFIKKFKVSPNLANQYYAKQDQIKKQKQLQLDFDEKYKLLCDYYDLMKKKQIKSYGQILKTYQYNSQLQKYEVSNNNALQNVQKTNNHSTKGKELLKYEFNKSNKKIQMQNQEVKYYQFLKYKIDINKDMILQFQVYHLNKIKKLKDQNRILRKEIDIVDGRIQKINVLFMQYIGSNVPKSRKNFSPSYNQTNNNMTSQQSLSSFWKSNKGLLSPNKVSRSSNSKSKNFIQINRSLKHVTSKSTKKLNTSRGMNENTQQKKNHIEQRNDYDILLLNSVEFNHALSNRQKKQMKQDAKNNTLLIESIEKDVYNRKRFVKQAEQNDYGVQSIIYEAKQMEQMPTLIKKQEIKPEIKRKSFSRSKNLVSPNIKKIRSEQNLGERKTLHNTKGQQKLKRKQIASEYYISLQDNLNKK